MSQALSPTCEKFRVPVELRVSSQVELDFSKRSCEVGEAYSCPTLKSTRTIRAVSRGGFAFEALVSHVAWQFCRQLKFIIDDVFHVDAGDAGVLKDGHQGRFTLS